MERNSQRKEEERPGIVKAVGLFSGGLDSILAAKVIQSQGIDVYVYHLKMVFCGKDSPAYKDKTAPQLIAEKIGVNYEEEEVTPEFIEIVQNPVHGGYGKNMNPCIDCKIFFMQKAKEYMEKIGAKFIFSGEVLGQRPMTQNLQSMTKIAKIAGVEDIIVRPLSAQLLPPTPPEIEGWVDRNRLLAISGRGRRAQMDMAAELGITNYPAPAGGCLLTDPIFSGRLKDLLTSENEFSINNIVLLKTGRHFRFSETVKCIVGRNEAENFSLANLAEEGDILFELKDELPGPLVILRGKGAEKYLKQGAALCRRYSNQKDNPDIDINYWKAEESITINCIKTENVSEDFLRDKMVRDMD